VLVALKDIEPLLSTNIVDYVDIKK